MNSVPLSIQNELIARLSVKIGESLPLEGGMVCSAARGETSNGRIFVKWKENAPPGFFAMEADGLQRLRKTGVVETPGVLACADSDTVPIAFLALDWIDADQPAVSSGVWSKLGESLALLHKNASANDSYGLEIDNLLGSQPQCNSWRSSWSTFYRDNRIMPQMKVAKSRGLMPAFREKLLTNLMDQFDSLLANYHTIPSLIHGDLWSGNMLASKNGPVLIDPAVYYADREMEIAYMQLFNGFPRNTFEAYDAAYPLDPGFEFRRSLHQLYPLIIHLNHFGELYGPQVERICYEYGNRAN